VYSRWIARFVHRSGPVPARCGTAREAGSVLTFTCPRCRTDASEEFYGPCSDCRQALRAEQGTDPVGTVTETAYEPKMNVTPNAVALKE
jgi:hypothetical protein